jgi:hypothetical protein
MCIAAAVWDILSRRRLVCYKGVQMSCGSAAARRVCWHACTSKVHERVTGRQMMRRRTPFPSHTSEAQSWKRRSL